MALIEVITKWKILTVNSFTDDLLYMIQFCQTLCTRLAILRPYGSEVITLIGVQKKKLEIETQP